MDIAKGLEQFEIMIKTLPADRTGPEIKKGEG